MGYSTSKKTLERIRPHLGFLEQGKECSWSTEDGGAARFAYRVREALAIARLYADEFPGLAKAAREFSIEVPRGNLVRAVRAARVDDMRVQVLNDETQLEEVKQAWLDTAGTVDSLYFPNAPLEDKELLMLYAWCQDHKALMFVSSPGLTLKQKTDDLVEFAWCPEDLGD